MMRQLFMEAVVGAPFDWGLATQDFALAWHRSALACARRSAPANTNGVATPSQFDLWPEEVLEAAPAPWTAATPDRAWTDAPRPKSLPGRRLSKREQAVRSARLQVVIPDRPRTRADCVGGPRPCPWVSCRHHLYADVSDNGWLKLNFPHLDVDEMAETCALDVADKGGITLEALGAVFNISLEGARQVELDCLGEVAVKLGIDDDIAAVRALLSGEARNVEGGDEAATMEGDSDG